jgi:hypothetical protein
VAEAVVSNPVHTAEVNRRLGVMERQVCISVAEAIISKPGQIAEAIKTTDIVGSSRNVSQWQKQLLLD